MSNARPSYQPRPGSRSSSKPSRKSTPPASSVDPADEVPTGAAIRAAAVTAPIATADPTPRGRVLVCMIRPRPGQPAPLDTAPTVGRGDFTGSLSCRQVNSPPNVPVHGPRVTKVERDPDCGSSSHPL